MPLRAPLEKPIASLNWMLLFSGVLFWVGLSSFPIYIVDEARNAQAAWEMYAGGEWIVPTFNGGVRTDKPPLHYYGVMVGYLIFGKTAFAARFVDQLPAGKDLQPVFRQKNLFEYPTTIIYRYHADE